MRALTVSGRLPLAIADHSAADPPVGEADGEQEAGVADAVGKANRALPVASGRSSEKPINSHDDRPHSSQPTNPSTALPERTISCMPARNRHGQEEAMEAGFAMQVVGREDQRRSR